MTEMPYVIMQQIYVFTGYSVPVWSIIPEGEYHKFATCLPTFYSLSTTDRGLNLFPG